MAIMDATASRHVNGELYYEHRGEARGLRARQYVYGIGSYHYNWHPALEVLVVVTGGMELCADGRVERCEPGDVMVINSNDGHATLATQPHTTVLLLHIDAGYLASFTQDGSVPRFSCRSAGSTRDQPGFARLRTLLARMMLASDRPGPGGKATWESRLLSVVATLFDRFPPEPSREPATDLPTAIESHQALRRAVAYVDQSFRERITLELLAQHSGFSPGYLSQLFPQHVGMTFSEYLTRVRLRQATRELGETDHLIAEVALHNGFPDVKAFNTAFRRTFGRTPSTYRRLLTEDTREADSVFHRSYISRTNAEVTQILRHWASLPSVADDANEGPCETASRLARLSPMDEALELARTLSAHLEELAGRTR